MIFLKVTNHYDGQAMPYGEPRLYFTKIITIYILKNKHIVATVIYCKAKRK